MANVTLTEACVKALQPRKTVRDVRDDKLRSFGVRVLPSGRKRFFIHCQHRGERVGVVKRWGKAVVQLARSSRYIELTRAKRWNGVLPTTVLNEGATPCCR